MLPAAIFFWSTEKINFIVHFAGKGDVQLSFVDSNSDNNSALLVDNDLLIRSNDNDSTGFWPPGSLHTLGADGYI